MPTPQEQWKALNPQQRELALSHMSAEQKQKLASTLGFQGGGTAQATLPPTRSSPPAPPDSFVGGLGRRAVSAAESMAAPPSGPGEVLAGPALPIYRALKGYPSSAYQGLKQASGYAKDAYNLPRGADPLTRFLTYMRAGTTGLAAINPLTSSSATNINTLTDQGRRAEAAGQGAFDAALLSLGAKGQPEANAAFASDISSALGSPTRGARILMQEAAGAGKEPVVLARRTAVETNAARQAAFQEGQEATRQGEQAARQAGAQRIVLDRTRQEYARRAIDNAKQVQAVVKSRLDARWNQMRQAIGQAPVETKPLQDAIAEAQTRFLAGSPESVTSFKQLTNFIESPGEVIQGAGRGETTPMTRPISWEEARTHYSNISDRMFSGELPGNVYQALKYVRQALDEQLNKTATQNGLGKQYTQLKSDYSQYKQDFDDTSGLTTGGGSPLARLVRFQAPQDAANLIKGKYAERLTDQIARYQNAGSNPRLLSAYRDLDRRAAEIEKPKIPAAPKPPKVETVDPQALRLQKLTEFAGRPFSGWDIINPIRAIDRALLKNESIRQSVARQPRKEIEP